MHQYTIAITGDVLSLFEPVQSTLEFRGQRGIRGPQYADLCGHANVQTRPLLGNDGLGAVQFRKGLGLICGLFHAIEMSESVGLLRADGIFARLDRKTDAHASADAIGHIL